ncbi:uncharacterized protein K460DRAFT_406145 [Cucurbitaria berberidis CBS 394.84]|uniref:Uncharacterized protein n=1 Tax=Cucurbitaria berberidis CBS 394.84 TaxID=1168544 RepID=A0A9P4L8D4_9PLEO|nr:uncharacterized protein K460DRAFT_406145 [Cucurbitaria berberidis CBS 394.84]KAF1845915.1 hypothetical protein K460DRAFT_406145 [Cucurbitaria berberidis CBS 394.84]
MCWALKNLHDESRTPYICEPTLPQFRLPDDQPPRPLQNEYPVWYFLTGGLSRAEKLMQLLQLDKEPDLRIASVKGLVQVHERQCSALMSPTRQQAWWGQDSCVGMAYRVQTEEEERRIRYFKTSYVSVIRCKITLSAKGTFGRPTEVDGLTFVCSAGVNKFRYMNSWPIRAVPGSIGCGRRQSTLQYFAPTTISMTARSTTATIRPKTSSVPVKIPRWMLNNPPPSLAAQNRLAAARGCENRAMMATRPHTIPTPGALHERKTKIIPKAKARSVSGERSTARSTEGAWWNPPSESAMKRLAREGGMSSATGSVEHIENLEQHNAHLQTGSGMQAQDGRAGDSVLADDSTEVAASATIIWANAHLASPPGPTSSSTGTSSNWKGKGRASDAQISAMVDVTVQYATHSTAVQIGADTMPTQWRQEEPKSASKLATSVPTTTQEQTAANRAAVRTRTTDAVSSSQDMIRRDGAMWRTRTAIAIASGRPIQAHVFQKLSIPSMLHIRRRRSFNGHTNVSAFDMYADAY